MTLSEPDSNEMRQIETLFTNLDKPFSIEECIEKLKSSTDVEDFSIDELQNKIETEINKKNGYLLEMADEKFISKKKFEEHKKNLSKNVLREIKKQGFTINEDKTIKQPNMNSKQAVRNFHASACADRYYKNIDFIEKNQNKLIRYFANGEDININKFEPAVQKIEPDTKQWKLFKFCTFLWSVPISKGFGRRTRFLVWDKNNAKIVGLFALGDPVFNLSARDELIGWNQEMKKKRLYNVMDIFILGAVPPYNTLLGGKLVAMIAATNEVRNVIYNKYKKSKTVILQEEKNPSLALLTTSSALGKSSIYDRIRFNNRVLYKRIGKSKGWGHFHLNHGLYEDMLHFLSWIDPSAVDSNRFGQGPNWKIRTAKKALYYLDLPTNLLRHGIQREIYAIPLAKNYIKYLVGKNDELDLYDMPFKDVTQFWKKRWLFGRAKRKPEYKYYDKEDTLKQIHKWGNK
ncbi:MAG: DUF4338 domain-containing protein [Kosmotogaceae bacterium]